MTILTLLAMVACLAATAESHAGLRREARTMRVLTCHAGAGERLVAVVVAWVTPAHLPARPAPDIDPPPADRGAPFRPAALREALLAIPPPAC